MLGTSSEIVNYCGPVKIFGSDGAKLVRRNAIPTGHVSKKVSARSSTEAALLRLRRRVTCKGNLNFVSVISGWKVRKIDACCTS
jgi:hypothetical protein